MNVAVLSVLGSIEQETHAISTAAAVVVTTNIVVAAAVEIESISVYCKFVERLLGVILLLRRPTDNCNWQN